MAVIRCLIWPAKVVDGQTLLWHSGDTGFQLIAARRLFKVPTVDTRNVPFDGRLPVADEGRRELSLPDGGDPLDDRRRAGGPGGASTTDRTGEHREVGE
jgi:hypothetical protein